MVVGFWLGYSQTSLILALNRCMSFSRHKWIFAGWRQKVWLAIPITFTLTVTLFGNAGVYDSTYKVSGLSEFGVVDGVRSGFLR